MRVEKKNRDAELICRIDVSALLAVIFVLIYTMEIFLPPSDTDSYISTLPRAITSVPLPGARRDDAILVNITPGGYVYLKNLRISLGALTQAIQEALAVNSEGTVYIAADRWCRYRDVKMALDAIRDAGARKVSFVTR
jgi:biopolymer transport protein ExbD